MSHTAMDSILVCNKLALKTFWKKMDQSEFALSLDNIKTYCQGKGNRLLTERNRLQNITQK